MPLPTPTRGRRMPARKKLLRGVAVNQPGSTPRQHQRHFTRGRLISAAFLFGQTHRGRGASSPRDPVGRVLREATVRCAPSIYRHRPNHSPQTPRSNSCHLKAISRRPATQNSRPTPHEKRATQPGKIRDPRLTDLPTVLLTEITRHVLFPSYHPYPLILTSRMQPTQLNKTPLCPACACKLTVKKGVRRNRLQTLQVFRCTECLHRFTGAQERTRPIRSTYSRNSLNLQPRLLPQRRLSRFCAGAITARSQSAPSAPG